MPVSFKNPPRKFLRYAGVSAITVPLTQLLLLMFYSAAGLPGTAANALAVSIAAVPGYLLNRSWVWQKNDSHSFSKEVLPFWVINLLGLVLSTLAVGWADNQTGNALVLVAVNIAVFGAIWVAKFSVLEQWLFAEKKAPSLSPAGRRPGF